MLNCCYFLICSWHSMNLGFSVWMSVTFDEVTRYVPSHSNTLVVKFIQLMKNSNVNQRFEIGTLLRRLHVLHFDHSVYSVLTSFNWGTRRLLLVHDTGAKRATNSNEVCWGNTTVYLDYFTCSVLAVDWSELLHSFDPSGSNMWNEGPPFRFCYLFN